MWYFLAIAGVVVVVGGVCFEVVRKDRVKLSIYDAVMGAAFYRTLLAKVLTQRKTDNLGLESLEPLSEKEGGWVGAFSKWTKTTTATTGAPVPLCVCMGVCVCGWVRVGVC